MKPIKRICLPISSSPADLLAETRDRCGSNTGNGMRAVIRYEDTVKGDFIERKEVERICGNCANEINVSFMIETGRSRLSPQAPLPEVGKPP